MASDSGEIKAITIINDNSRSWVCIFILFNPFSSWCSQMTLKGLGHRERRFAQAGRPALSPRGAHLGAGGGREKPGLGRGSPARSQPGAPGTRPGPSPDYPAEGKAPPQPPAQNPHSPGRARGGSPSSNGWKR